MINVMDIRQISFPDQAAMALLEQITPNSILCSIRPVGGDFANHQFYLDTRTKEGENLHFVVKLYQGERDYCIRRARVEYKALQWLHYHKRPTPEPVFLDDTGELLGSPGLVTHYLPGSPIIDPPYPPDWGRKMALTLANIHAYPCDASAQTFLLDGNREALWFRQTGIMPDWLAANPDGLLIWEMIERLLAHQEKTTPKLVHLDFWGGNVLCQEGKITAVLDWEEASYGDPGVDVAYCLMNLVLCGLDQDAVEFLSTYVAETGDSTANLVLWKLAAAARPILDPVGWYLYDSPVKERFRIFVQEAVQEGNLLKLI
jgi:aminoglycoside phosphotransferase (APT) family kinase protein